jgi:hypothetical protein
VTRICRGIRGYPWTFLSLNVPSKVEEGPALSLLAFLLPGHTAKHLDITRKSHAESVTYLMLSLAVICGIIVA